MRLTVSFAAVLVGLSIVTPTVAQSMPETRDEAARRRQAEQYEHEKKQNQQGNSLNTQRPQPLGEAPDSRFGSPRSGSNSNSNNCPSYNPNCR